MKVFTSNVAAKTVFLASLIAVSFLSTAVTAQDGFQPAQPAEETLLPVVEAPPEMPRPPEAAQAAVPAPESQADAPAAQAEEARREPAKNATALAEFPADAAILVSIADAKSNVRDSSVTPEAMSSLFYTAWQHALLQEAKIGFNTRLPDPGEDSSGRSRVRDPGKRELSLGGIAYANEKKWTVWLNGVRVTPDAIPSEVLDIKVRDAYIDLKWFDGYTNKIYPVRLRPHERFNLDTRIFLPGNGTL